MKILIAGAGPAGLATAIELARGGVMARIIDRKSEPSPLSRAVGIAAHTLDLLEPSGVTAGLLAEGVKIRHLAMHVDGCIRLRINFGFLQHRYNFLLALPQNRTEAIMQKRFHEMGGHVEYGTALESISVAGGKAHAVLNRGGKKTEEIFDIVIGAEGLHSIVREAAGIAMPGYEYEQDWSIADFDSTDWPYPAAELHAFVEKETISLAVVIAKNRFRAVANTADALLALPVKFHADKVNESGAFRIHVRQAETYQKGPFFLAGDAAHVHSPAGARGMNIGIEDGCALAWRLLNGTVEGYTAERHPVGRRTIRLTERLISTVLSKNPLVKVLRNFMFFVISHSPFLQKIALREVSGLNQAG